MPCNYGTSSITDLLHIKTAPDEILNCLMLIIVPAYL